VPFHIMLRLCAVSTRRMTEPFFFISSHHMCYIHGNAFTFLFVTSTVLLMTGGGVILACHISPRAAFICRAFTGIIILCRCVGRWAVWICTCRTSTSSVSARGGEERIPPSSNTSPMPTAAQNSADRRVDSGKTGTAVGSDQTYGWDRIVTLCATVWRHSCVAYGRHELEKSS